MRLVFGLVLMVGLALAGGAVYQVKSYVDRYQAALAAERAKSRPPIELTEIFIAKEKLGYGDKLTAEKIRKVKWPKEAVPEGAFTDKAALFPEDGPAERTVLRRMEALEPLLAVKLTEPGGNAGIAASLKDGMRAFAINVDVASGVSGFLRPGDRVDIYWTGRAGASPREEREITKLIGSGVRLIAVDQSVNADAAKPTVARTVTVAATQQQVAGLALAQTTGRLALSLVGRGDKTTSAKVEVDQHELLGIKPEKKIAKVEEEPEETCFITTRRGADVVKTPIPCTN